MLSGPNLQRLSLTSTLFLSMFNQVKLRRSAESVLFKTTNMSKTCTEVYKFNFDVSHWLNFDVGSSGFVGLDHPIESRDSFCSTQPLNSNHQTQTTKSGGHSVRIRAELNMDITGFFRCMEFLNFVRIIKVHFRWIWQLINFSVQIQKYSN